MQPVLFIMNNIQDYKRIQLRFHKHHVTTWKGLRNFLILFKYLLVNPSYHLFNKEITFSIDASLNQHNHFL